MKKIIYIPLVIAAAVTVSCTKTQYKDFDAVSSGSADFTNYISVGNSLTQGYQDGGLHNEYQQQANSYPAIIAKQMGVNFVQPMVDGAGSGHKFLQALNVTPTITDVAPDSRFDFGNPSIGQAGTGWATWSTTTKYNNLGMAGIKLTDCVPTVGNPLSPNINQFITSFNPFGTFLDFGSALSPRSYLQSVKESNATFFTCWLGNNDVLGWALAGGSNSPITIPLLSTINTSELTPVTVFRNKYDSILGAFQTMGAKGVCATLPDVTSIPFFTTVPYNPIPLDATSAASLNAGYASYNSGLDGLVTAGMITASEAAQRKINFVAGDSNAIVIMDESLTDLTAVNPAMVNMRQATAADLILLTASSDIGRVFSPTQIYGLSVPFADSLVLTATEVNTVKNHTALINNEIRSSAAAHNDAVVDMNAYMVTLKSGMTFDGVDYTAKYIAGGAFSLDGVHPNTRGYAIIANKFIETINAAYGSNLHPVAVQNYRGIIFP